MEATVKLPPDAELLCPDGRLAMLRVGVWMCPTALDDDEIAEKIKFLREIALKRPKATKRLQEMLNA